jgi:hypothetical protein
MNILRRRVRSAFLLGTITFVGLIVVSVSHPELAENYNPIAFYGVLFVSAVLAVLFGAAWLTTRKPSSYRNNWAVAASSLSLLWGAFLAYAIFRIMPGRLEAEIPALATCLVGAAGLYLYAPGGSPAKPESATKSTAPAKSVEPDYAPSALLPVRVPASTPTALAPSLAAASSSELAAAAASPRDPNAPWDPLAFMRTPEILEKVRG